MSDILDGLDPEQRAAVLAPRGPVCVLAGAGTGKTRTITRRIAHLTSSGQVNPGQVLAVTFTARAAGEMRGRLRSLGVGGAGSVQAQTFHAAALRQLRYFWPQVFGELRWELLDNKFQVVSRAANRVGLSTSKESVRDLAGEIEWAKASLIGPSGYAEHVAEIGREIPQPADKVARVFALYERLKVGENGDRLFDFDDLLIYTTAILRTERAVAEEFRERYRCFVVDEYQDVTPVQQGLLDEWLGARDDLTVVGDANQTIYSFTGATPSYLLDFTRRFPDATLVRLERDYRSTPQVVGLANRVIGQARGRIAGTRLRLLGQRPAGPEPVFAEYPDEPAEAAAVATKVAALIEKGVPASEIAILYRINAQSENHEQALTEAGIPYQVRGGESFYTRTEVRQAMRGLTEAARRDDLPADADIPTLTRAVLAPLGLSPQEPSGAQARARWESLRAVAALVDDLAAAQPDLTLRSVVAELNARAQSRHPPTVQGVTLSSLHAAKGLEWDAVFLVGLTDGSMPISRAINGGFDAIEEERRLFYVGVTRAREHLQVSWALARNEGGRTRRRSRFVTDDIVPNHSPVSRIAEPAPVHRGPSCRICGTRLVGSAAALLGRCERCPADIDEDLLGELRQWRDEVADAKKVPAFTVLSDKTLTAIAEQLPVTHLQLLQIGGIGQRKLGAYGDDVISIVTKSTGGVLLDVGPSMMHDVQMGSRKSLSSRAGESDVSKGFALEQPRDYLPTGVEPDGWLERQLCSSQAYREELYQRRFDSHVRPINEYVQVLRARRSGDLIPYVAPTYGGVNARLLALLQDPGPKTDTESMHGSGMLCVENVDFSAARMKHFLAKSDIAVSEIMAWNAYPWPKPHPQTLEDDREAAKALLGLIELLPKLTVVVLNGGVAKRIWRVMKHAHPDAAAQVGYVCSTYHPSPKAVDPDEKSVGYIERVNGDISKAYRSARRMLDMA